MERGGSLWQLSVLPVTESTALDSAVRPSKLPRWVGHCKMVRRELLRQLSAPFSSALPNTTCLVFGVHRELATAACLADESPDLDSIRQLHRCFFPALLATLLVWRRDLATFTYLANESTALDSFVTPSAKVCCRLASFSNQG